MVDVAGYELAILYQIGLFCNTIDILEIFRCLRFSDFHSNFLSSKNDAILPERVQWLSRGTMGCTVASQKFYFLKQILSMREEASRSPSKDIQQEFPTNGSYRKAVTFVLSLISSTLVYLDAVCWNQAQCGLR